MAPDEPILEYLSINEHESLKEQYVVRKKQVLEGQLAPH
jgi:hypothetical protein